MTDIQKFFDKIPIDKLYEDLFQPGLKKAGIALKDVMEFGLTILLPIKLINEKSKLLFKKHLEKYNKKLETIDQAKLCQVPTNLGLPVVDRLTYLDQSVLADAFINLLAKASSFDTINMVHPAFLLTLDNLCSDEARILKNYKDAESIPLIDISIKRYEEKISKPDFYDARGPKSRDQLKQLINYNYQNRSEVIIKANWNLTGIEKNTQLDFPFNINIYLENLLKQGLIAFERNLYNKDQETIYLELEENIYLKEIKETESLIKEFLTEPNHFNKADLIIERGYIEFTEFGKAFIKACIIE